ncbi:MAG: hypothetical protein FWG89_00085 [Treponema sp.]|nr:hypothetical protein [Treponema sp.]
MRRALCFILVCAFGFFAILACLSTAQTQDNDLPDLPQTYQHSGSRGGLVFVGVSVLFSDRQESINNALKDAARKFSFFNSVSGSYSVNEHTGRSIFDDSFISEYQLHYDNDLEKFIEQLEFDPENDIFENNNALFIVARAPSGPVMPLASGHSSGGSRPLWLDSPPVEIGGYSVGIGYSDRHNSHHDTFVKSYEMAVINIIGNKGSYISSETHSYQGASVFDFSESAASEMNVSGTIINFYVIESWTDPLNLSVWTLAIATNE